MNKLRFKISFITEESPNEFQRSIDNLIHELMLCYGCFVRYSNDFDIRFCDFVSELILTYKIEVMYDSDYECSLLDCLDSAFKKFESLGCLLNY